MSGHWLLALEWSLILIAASSVVFAVGAHLSGRLYLAGWINAVPPRRRHAAVIRSHGSVRAIPLLDRVVSSIVIKDWRMRTRDLAQLARFAMPVIFLFVLFGFRSSRLLSSVQSLGNGPVAAMLGLLPSWILLLSLSSALGLTAVSLEGKNIWIYAASPNSVLRLLQAKCWSAALPTVAAVTLVAVMTEAVIRPGWLWAATATALAVVQAAAVTALMVAIGAVFARFDWTDVRRMLHPVAGLARIHRILHGHRDECPADGRGAGPRDGGPSPPRDHLARVPDLFRRRGDRGRGPGPPAQRQPAPAPRTRLGRRRSRAPWLP